MIQDGTKLVVTDNSGAQYVKVFKIVGGSKKHYAFTGDIAIASVKKMRSGVTKPKVHKKDIVKVMIVRTRKQTKRKDGSYICFDDNACIIVDIKKGKPEMLGTRILGPLPREIREYGHLKIVSLAKEVI